MYSDNIEKICRVCRYSQRAKGSAEHLKCTRRGGYTPISGSCADFAYDIFKKTVRRKKTVSRKFSADDFRL